MFFLFLCRARIARWSHSEAKTRVATVSMPMHISWVSVVHVIQCDVRVHFRVTRQHLNSSTNDGKCCGALSCFIHEMLSSLFIISQPLGIATIFSGNASHKKVLTFEIQREQRRRAQETSEQREHRLAQQRQRRQPETEGQRKAR